MACLVEQDGRKLVTVDEIIKEFLSVFQSLLVKTEPGHVGANIEVTLTDATLPVEKGHSS